MKNLYLTVHFIIKCDAKDCKETKNLSQVTFHREDGITQNETLCLKCIEIAEKTLTNPRFLS